MLDGKEQGARFELLFSLLWIVAVLPKYMQLALLLSVLIYLFHKTEWKIRLDSFSSLIVSYIGVYLVSITLATASIGGIGRCLAAINNAMTWVIAVFFYAIYSNAQVCMAKIYKACFTNILVMFFLAVYAKCSFEKGNDAFAIPVIGQLYAREWPSYRFSAFLDYPTLVVAIILLVMPGALCYLLSKGCKWASLLIAIYLVANGFSLYYSYSRSGYVLYALGAIGVLVSCLITDKRIRILVPVFGILIILILMCTPLIQSVVGKLLSLREGSNNSRMIIYTETFQAFCRKPIIGCGIKEASSIGYPKGSHCTYLGFLYKTGILGTVCVLSAFAQKIAELVRIFFREKKEMVICAIFLLLVFAFAIFEDLDGADWLLCVFFACLGFASNPKNRVTKNI